MWNKGNNSIKKGFDSGPVYNEKYFKIKIKSYERKININFHDDEMLKEGFHCISISAILIDSVFTIDKKF